MRLADAQALAILVEAERELACPHFLPKREKGIPATDGKLPDQARLYVVSANVDQALNNLKIMRGQLEEQRGTLKNEQRLKENQKQSADTGSEIAELMRDYQGLGEIQLGAKLIIQQGNTYITSICIRRKSCRISARHSAAQRGH